MREGYILIATGSNKYIEQAEQAAKSIRFFDKTRPICLAYEKAIKPQVSKLRFFDDTVKITRKLLGTENHLYLNELSPYEKTLYVDSDCLASSSRLLEAWIEFRKYSIVFPGSKIVEGWRVDTAKALARFKVSYLVKNNGGVFGFDNTKISEDFFKRSQKTFEKRIPEVTIKHCSGGGIANEPIWGSTLALQALPIFPLEYDLNVSTKRINGWSITSEPSIKLLKEQEKSPVFCHFLGLGKPKCPNNLYRAFLEVIC